jgi:hypothetical protein
MINLPLAPLFPRQDFLGLCELDNTLASKVMIKPTYVRNNQTLKNVVEIDFGLRHGPQYLTRLAHDKKHEEHYKPHFSPQTR